MRDAVVELRVEALEVEHCAVNVRCEPDPGVDVGRAVGIDEPSEPGQRRFGLHRFEEREQELGLKGGLAASDGDATHERCGGQEFLDHLADGGAEMLARGAADGVRVVTRHTVEVATLHEHNEPVARAIDHAERECVGDHAVGSDCVERVGGVAGAHSLRPIRCTARWVRWNERSAPAAR